MRCTVSVPASSANLGSGFDTLAIALDLSMTVDVEARPGAEIVVRRGPDLFGGDDLVAQGIREVAAAAAMPVPGCWLDVTSEIPVARGLGSSASALIAGLVIGNQLLGEPLSRAELLAIATRIEGHGDNVSASLYGGITLAVMTGDDVIFRPVPVAGDLRTVSFVPEALGLTVDARAVVPTRIPRQDAVANIGRCALLMLALTQGEFELLGEAMCDRLHQPYRESLFPHVPRMIAAATRAGAYGACLSGAGPSVLALCAPERAEDVCGAMQAEADGSGTSGRAMVLDVAWRGAEVLSGVAPER